MGCSAQPRQASPTRNEQRLPSACVTKLLNILYDRVNRCSGNTTIRAVVRRGSLRFGGKSVTVDRQPDEAVARHRLFDARGSRRAFRLTAQGFTVAPEPGREVSGALRTR